MTRSTGSPPRYEGHAAVQHLHGGLAWILVLVEVAVGPEGDQGLAQDVLVPAVHRVGASTARCRLGRLQVDADKRGQ